jgi:hypothetical protein
MLFRVANHVDDPGVEHRLAMKVKVDEFDSAVPCIVYDPFIQVKLHISFLSAHSVTRAADTVDSAVVGWLDLKRQGSGTLHHGVAGKPRYKEWQLLVQQ